MIRCKSFFLLAACLTGHADTARATHFGQFKASQCGEERINKGSGSDKGQGILRYCDNGTDQMIYVSGELDDPDDGRSDLPAIRRTIAKFKTRAKGRFEIVTFNAGGGTVELHQQLMMAVEDACLKDCRINTTVIGLCGSACNQLHLTCAKGATTKLRPGARMCEHASVGDHHGHEGCDRCDPHPDEPKPRNTKARKAWMDRNCAVCGPEESVREYVMRCGSSLKGRKVNVDPGKRAQIESFAKSLADRGVFDTSRFTCEPPPPWALKDGPRPTSSKPGDAPVGR